MYSFILYNSSTRDYFNSEGRVNFDKNQIKNFDNIYKPLDEFKVLKNDKDTNSFFSLIRKMLDVDQNKRITMRKYSLDPFISTMHQFKKNKFQATH